MVDHLAGVLGEGQHVAGIDHHSVVLSTPHELGQLPLSHTVAMYSPWIGIANFGCTRE